MEYKDAMNKSMGKDIADIIEGFSDRFGNLEMSGVMQLVMLAVTADAAKQAYEKGYAKGFEYAKQEQTLQSMME